VTKSLNQVTTEDLKSELRRRGITTAPTVCPTCRKWKAATYAWRFRHATLNCQGCRLPVEACRCQP
jgi:hypothetical protein